MSSFIQIWTRIAITKHLIPNASSTAVMQKPPPYYPLPLILFFFQSYPLPHLLLLLRLPLPRRYPPSSSYPPTLPFLLPWHPLLWSSERRGGAESGTQREAAACGGGMKQRRAARTELGVVEQWREAAGSQIQNPSKYDSHLDIEHSIQQQCHDTIAATSLPSVYMLKH